MLNKILAGITQDGEIYVLEITYRDPEHNYFAMTGFTSTPVTLKEAKEEAYNTFLDYFSDLENIREMNERLGTKFRSAKAAVKYVLEVDGELHGFDNSLLTDEIEYEGKTYLFRSGSAGQHQERDLKDYFIPPATFKELMNIWSKFHLKEENPKLPSIPEQDWDKLLKKAIGIIRFGKHKKHLSEEEIKHLE